MNTSRSGRSKIYEQWAADVERANEKSSQAEANVQPTVYKEEEESPVSVTETPAAQPITSTLEPSLWYSIKLIEQSCRRIVPTR